MDLTEEEVQRILRLVDEMEYGEIHLEVGQLKIDLVKAPAGERAQSRAPATTDRVQRTSAPVHARASEAPRNVSAIAFGARTDASPIVGAHLVTAPTGGTFFRAPAPGAKPFVEVGLRVAREDTVCLLEVMKLFHSVPAGVDGRIVQVLVDDAQAVVAGQPLFAIDVEHAP